jgi:penicillin-binding protein 1A
MRRALFESRNVPTIRLGIELGIPSVIDEARKFGITTPIPGYPSIFIGAADVYPIELVAAYTTFATLGTRAEPMAITKVQDQKGNTLWEPQPTTLPILSPEEAWLMVSMMKDVVQRGTAAGTVGSQIRFPAGGKTGTTNDGTNVWFVGYSQDLVAGVWMGFDKPTKIKSNAQGGILAAPAWVAFMNEVYRRRPAPRDWAMPPDIIQRQVDVSTNMLATPYCPPSAVVNEYFIPGTDPIMPCDVHTGVLYPDTSGVGALYPRTDSLGRPIPAPPYPGTPGVVPPPGAGGTRPLPPRPGIDTSRRYRDSTIFSLPPRDTTRRRDSLRIDTLRAKLDSLRRRDTTRVRPPRPDTLQRSSLELE